MSRITLFLAAFMSGLFVYAGSIFAAGAVDTSAFRMVQEVALPSLQVPTVMEMPIAQQFGRKDFAVVSDKENVLVPYLYRQSRVPEAPFASAVSAPENTRSASLIDGNSETFAEYPIVNDGETSLAEIRLSGKKAVTADSFSLSLGQNVALPKTVQVGVIGFGGEEKIVLATQAMKSEIVRFPETTSDRWIIRLAFSQPLRIHEIAFSNKQADARVTQGIRFLAQPGQSYHVYADPDRFVKKSTGESGNLSDNNDVVSVQASVFRENPTFKQADTDEDGVADLLDNCVSAKNADQADVNGNGRGDACDDFDKDGVANAIDNCRDLPNMNQSDKDSDGKGDVCDGEESRFTEKYAWLPWVAIGFVGCVIVALFVAVLRRKGV